jgi:hypothetical protein
MLKMFKVFMKRIVTKNRINKMIIIMMIEYKDLEIKMNNTMNMMEGSLEEEVILMIAWELISINIIKCSITVEIWDLVALKIRLLSKSSNNNKILNYQIFNKRNELIIAIIKLSILFLKLLIL